MTERTKASTKEIIQRTGALMLKGWKLLAIACPICSTTLLSKDKHMRCPGCDMPVVMEAEPAHSAQPPKAPTVPDDYKSTKVIEEVASEPVDEPKTYEELRKEFEAKKQRSSQVSARLGEKMLEGWTMLGESCPNAISCEGTPLMKDPSSELMHCVNCHQRFLYSSHGDLINKDHPLQQHNTVPVNSSKQPEVNELDEFDDVDVDLDAKEEPPRLSRFSQNKEDSSWKLSQKLLLGWAILDDCCKTEKCRGVTPLMRDLNGKVTMNTYFIFFSDLSF
jgi:uncharacterized Zn finger protein (UPF0148 family)